MIATIPVIAAIAKRKKDQQSQWSLRSYGNHFPAITTITDIELFLFQQLLSLRLLRSLQSLESGFHMIAMIPAIAELFFFSAIVAIIWKPGLRSNRETKCDITKVQICEIMELIGIFRKNKVKNAHLQEISVLVQIR